MHLHACTLRIHARRPNQHRSRLCLLYTRATSFPTSPPQAARFYLQSGLQALPLPPNGIAAPAGSLAAAQQQEAAAYHLHLALALWTRAGGTVPGAGPMGQPAAELADAGVTPGGTTAASVTAAAERKRPVGPSASAAAAPLRAECREHLLAAAAVAGPLQAAAFAWLGHWYGWPPAEEGGEEGAAAAAAAAAAGVGTDAVKAARCYQRALMLDPNQVGGPRLGKRMCSTPLCPSSLGLFATLCLPAGWLPARAAKLADARPLLVMHPDGTHSTHSTHP